MRTTKDERKWLSFNWRPEGSTFRQWVAGSSKAHALIPSLITAVDDAVKLLKNARQDMHLAVAVLLDAERHIFSGGKGQQTSTLQEKVIRARKLLERTAPYAAFLKEPSE